MAQMLADPARALENHEYWAEPICRRWLQHAAEHIHLNVSEALQLAIIGVRLARRVVAAQQRKAIRHRCVLASAFAVLGSAYCASGELGKASHALAKAAELATRCTDRDIRSNVHRLQANLQVFLAQRADGSSDPAVLQEGMRLAELALREARSPVAEARALNARGYLEVAMGNPRAGAASARRALDLIGPTADLFTHAATTSLLVWALGSGDAADRREAIEHLEKLREALPRRSPAHRARLLWAEALIHIHDPRRKPRARLRLDQARRKFLNLKMQAEAIAVTADLTRLNPSGPVTTLCDELLAILDPGPIRELVAYLRKADFMERTNLAEQLRRAIQGPGLLPAAAWPKL